MWTYLALAAERFPALSERIAVNPGHAVRDELLLWCLMGSVFVGFLCFCAWEGGIAIWDGLLVGALVIFLGVPLRALGAYRKAQRVSGRVDLENGCLTIWNPAYGRASWALHDCRWHIGNVREAETFFFRPQFETRGSDSRVSAHGFVLEGAHQGSLWPEPGDARGMGSLPHIGWY